MRKRQPKAVMANDLLTGNLSMTEVEHNVFMLLIASIRKEDKLSMETWYTFPLEDYAELAKATRGSAYEATKLACKKLLHQTCIIKNGNSTVLVNLVTAIKFEDGEIKATFHRELFPYISELVSRFTSIDVRECFLIHKPQLKNLYTLLVADRWKGKNTLPKDLEYLYEILNIPLSYRNYKEFNKHILSRAAREFNNLGFGTLQIMPIKEGRRVIKVRITMNWSDKESKL